MNGKRSILVVDDLLHKPFDLDELLACFTKVFVK